MATSQIMIGCCIHRSSKWRTDHQHILKFRFQSVIVLLFCVVEGICIQCANDRSVDQNCDVQRTSKTVVRKVYFQTPPVCLFIWRCVVLFVTCLSARILQDVVEDIHVSLVRLCRRILQEGHWPKLWRFHNLVPIYKRKSIHDANNYRDVRIISILSKVFERIVGTSMLTFSGRQGCYGLQQWPYRTRRFSIFCFPAPLWCKRVSR